MKNNFKIDKHTVGYNQSVFFIAEAGVNHNGRLDLALKLVDEAAKAGADAVKFQTFKAEQVSTSSATMAEYQVKNIGTVKSQTEMLRHLELKEEFYPAIIQRCKKKGIMFLSTPHGGFESVDFLENLNVPAFKFGSGDLTNLPLLKYAAKFKKPMILGTGIATMREIKEAISIIKSIGNDKIIVLHCTSNYPCPPEEVNLSAMIAMMKKMGVLVGYSDHTLGVQVPIMATTLGACVLEKHFTLDKNMSGPDHKASVDPEELRAIVDAIRKVEIIMGSPEKRPQKSELSVIKLSRKSVVAKKDIVKGEKFSVLNLAVKRPGGGLAPKYYDSLIGKVSSRNIRCDTLIKKNLLRRIE